MQGFKVIVDENTNDVFLETFLMTTEYINKQGWKPSSDDDFIHYDKSIAQSMGHVLIAYPSTDDKGNFILDHPKYDYGNPNAPDKLYNDQAPFTVGKNILTKRQTKTDRPGLTRALYNISDPNLKKYLEENAEEINEGKIPLYTSASILYGNDEDDKNIKNFVIAHNALVTSPANKPEDAGLAQMCKGDIGSTCKHLAASLNSPCNLMESKPIPKGIDLYQILNQNLNTSQKADGENKSIMVNNASDPASGSQTGNEGTKGVNAPNPQTNPSGNDKGAQGNSNNQSPDIKVLEDYKSKNAELEKQLAEMKKGNNEKTEAANNKALEELQLMKRENAIVKILPSDLFKDQAEYDKELEKFVKSPYSMDDIKNLIDSKVEIARLKAERTQPVNTQNGYASTSFNQAGKNFAKASDSDDKNNNNKPTNVMDLPHMRGLKNILGATGNFGGLV